jgi:hypothetical protein
MLLAPAKGIIGALSLTIPSAHIIRYLPEVGTKTAQLKVSDIKREKFCGVCLILLRLQPALYTFTTGIGFQRSTMVKRFLMASSMKDCTAALKIAYAIARR